jgi:protein arginine N-methyltransferase 1
VRMTIFRNGLGQALAEVAVDLRSRVARNPRARAALYRLRNRLVFSDLYQHDRLLADRVRVDAYHEALTKHIREGDVVLDLGTGSGVLSFFAAKRAARVHAVEHGRIIESAMAVARDNGITNVEFHRTGSRSFTSPEPVDVIIHEQIGDALFDERVVDNIADLRDRLLAPGGRIHPSRLELFIEPVQLREDMRSPFAWQQDDLYGINFRALRELEDKQPQGYRYRLFRPFPFGHLLCAPEPVVSIDLMTATAADLPTEISFERPVETPGIHDGFCVYFTARFDDEIAFTTSPESTGTSWANPLLRVETRTVGVGDTIRLSLRADDLADTATWRW